MAQSQIFRGPNRATMRHSGDGKDIPGCTDYILHNTVIVKLWDNGMVTPNAALTERGD